MADTDDELLNKIDSAVAEHNDAERAVTSAKSAVATAQSELESKSRVVGELLLEAKKRHTKVADFKAFLERINGLKLSRAYDLMKLAGGGTTEDQLRKDARVRKQKSRGKKKLLPPPPLPNPETTKPPLSVTDPHVTESNNFWPDIIRREEERQAQNAALGTEVRPEPTGTTTTGTTTTPLLDFDRSTATKRSQGSRDPLNEFKYACKTWLPQIADEADRQEALRFAAEMLAGKNAEAA